MLHENIFTNGLLYALGVVAGKNQPSNLFHKLPPGKSYADLLQQWEGRNFIVELKRDESGLRSEVEKSNRTRLMIALAASGYVSFNDVSEQCHFIAYGSGNDNGDALHFKKYIRFDKSKEPATPLDKFITLIRDPHTAFGAKEGKVFKAYLDIVIKCAGDKAVSGVLINITPDQPPYCISFHSYATLGKQLYNAIVDVKPSRKKPG